MAENTVSSCVESETQKSVDVFSPTEYTTMLIGFLQENADRVADRTVCEIGTGNGVIAVQSALLGARSVTVSDVEQDALDAVSASFSRVAQGPAEFNCLHGPLWQPHGTRRFDLILANLPHFPATSLTLPGRLPTWSMGGADGRKMLDPFLEGLSEHLAPGGLAAFTHNRFVGIEQTRACLRAQGLSVQTCCETIVHLSPLKVSALPHGPSGYGQDVFTLGKHVFGRVCLAIASWT